MTPAARPTTAATQALTLAWSLSNATATPSQAKGCKPDLDEVSPSENLTRLELFGFSRTGIAGSLLRVLGFLRMGGQIHRRSGGSQASRCGSPGLPIPTDGTARGPADKVISSGATEAWMITHHRCGLMLLFRGYGLTADPGALSLVMRPPDRASRRDCGAWRGCRDGRGPAPASCR
jgi:hypothetical protein